MKYITENIEELDLSYKSIKRTLAYRDLMKFMIEEKVTAQRKLKLADNSLARATWIMVDKFFERSKLIEREVLKRQKEKDKE